MCLAYPARVVEIEDSLATVELSGVRRKVSLMLLPETKLGDFVLVHAGFAMQTVDRKEVDEMLEIYDEIDRLEKDSEKGSEKGTASAL